MDGSVINRILVYLEQVFIDIESTRIAGQVPEDKITASVSRTVAMKFKIPVEEATKMVSDYKSKTEGQ